MPGPAPFSPPPQGTAGPQRLGAWVAAASALTLAACAAIPKLGEAPQPKPASAYATAESFKAPAADWPADRWWTAYGDPQLDQIIDEALKGSPSLAQAAARVRKAEASRAQARAGLLPSLDAQGLIADTKSSLNEGFPPFIQELLPHGYQDNGRFVLNLNYEFDFWGKNRSAVAAATSEIRAAQAEAAQARLALSTSIASAYADLSRLYAEREVAERSAQVRMETFTLVSHRVEGGLDTRAELKQAEAGAPAARAEVAALDEQIALSKNEIAALMGQGPDRGLTIQRPATASLKAFGLPPTLAADLLGRRPDVVAARWRAEAAAKRIGVAKAAFYPDINLAAYIGQQALGLDKLLQMNSQVGDVHAAATLPIFEGGRLRANLRGARADYDDAVAAYDGTLSEALRQVADAAAGQRALAVRLSESRQALAADEEAYKIARLRYEGGLANYQSVLLA